ncbi:6-phosphofructokinase [Nitratifractor sp.]
MKRFAIMGSGGDAPGMNAAVKKFVDLALMRGIRPFLIQDGLEGLIDGRIREANHADVAGILHRGGCVIGSSRSKRFYDKRWRKAAYEQLQARGIEGLVVLGGDGSFRAMERFHEEFGVSFVGIPTTIDNDIYGTEYCLGVDTALNTVREALDRIYDTASTFGRAFVVEVMGRECGYLAAISALGSGAEICLIPEVDFDYDVAEARLRAQIAAGRRYVLAVVAEGTKQTGSLARWLEKTFSLETRVTVLGHVQRGGAPSSRDRLAGFEFAVYALTRLEEGEAAHVCVYRDGGYDFLPIKEVVSNRYTLDLTHLSMLNFLD